MSCDKAFQDPCHSATRERKYVQQHIRICTHGVKTGLGQGHHRTIDTQSQLISQSQVRPSQWLMGAGAQTRPMPCSVRTLKPCQWERCPTQPQATSWEPSSLKAHRQWLPMLPQQQVRTPSQRYGPAIITQELVAENGLFQPKLELAQKSPKLTSCLDPPGVGTRQLTLCPSSTNFLEPPPNLVPPEVPASGHHGFVKWGHDAKITKIGVIPTRGSPGQGKANGSQGRRQDLGLLSECTT